MAACALAPAFGAVVALQPLAAVGLVAVVVITALAFLAPVTHLALLIFLTTIVPYSVNNRYAAGAGAGSPGLLGSDLFLMTGLARAALLLPRARLGHRRIIVLGLIIAFVVWVLQASYAGIRAGESISNVGVELRALLGFSTVVVAMAVLMERRSQERLARALVVLGLLLGLWGIVQWQFDLPFASDFGVRAGVRYSEGGRGQVQGGLFVFPSAVILAAGALMTGRVPRGPARWTVIAVLVLNALSLLLTFERTFWVVSVLGVVVVALRDGRVRRGRALLWSTVLAVVALASVSAVSPGTFQTARERLLSIGQYGSDDSLRYRRVESEHVSTRIARHPVFGSGLAAPIWWGQPWNGVPPTTERYTHNGYLWLVWRLGVVGGGLLLALLALAICLRGPPGGGSLFASLRVGAQASLLAVLVATVAFPSFNGYGVTSAMGLMVAMCAVPPGALRDEELPDEAPGQST